MKLQLKDIIYIAIIVSIAFLGIKFISDTKQKLNQSRQSYAQELSAEKEKYIKFDRYMQKRLDVYAAKVSQLADSLKIKPKYIQDVVEVEISHVDTVRDTVFIRTPPPEFAWEQFTLDDGCMTVSGISPCDLIITEKSYNDSLFLFKYDQRSHLFGWKFLPKWGRKETEIKTHSVCGDVEVVWREFVE